MLFRSLGIDHGTVRIGIAVSDEMGIVAHPLESVPAEPWNRFLSRLEEILRDKQVDLVLVGMPRNMDGGYGPAAEKVRDFVTRLEAAIAVPIRTWDERLTSVQANRFLIQANIRRSDRRGKVDKTAAAILLQSYLDSREEGS